MKRKLKAILFIIILAFVLALEWFLCNDSNASYKNESSTGYHSGIIDITDVNQIALSSNEIINIVPGSINSVAGDLVKVDFDNLSWNLRNNEFMYCIQHNIDIYTPTYLVEKLNIIKNLDKRVVQYTNNPTTDITFSAEKNAEYAYILAYPEIKDSTWSSPLQGYYTKQPDGTYKLENHYPYSFLSEKQNAVWLSQGQGAAIYANYNATTGVYTDVNPNIGQTLLNEASSFASYRSNANSNPPQVQATSPTFDSTNLKIGPYKIKYAQGSYNSVDFGGIVNKTLKYTKVGSAIEYELSSSEYQIIQGGVAVNLPSSGNDFYIQLTANSISNNNIYKIKSINFGIRETCVGAIYYNIVQANVTNSQDFSIVYYARLWVEDKNISVNIDQQLVPPMNLKLKKTSASGIYNINGADFTVTYQQGGSTIATRTGTTAGVGEISFASVQPSSRSPITVTIHETDAINGFKLLSEDIVLTFTYNSSDFSWTTTSTTDTLSGGETYSVDVTSNIITVSAVDIPIIEKLTLFKKNSVDSSKLVVGAEFTVDMTNVNKVGGVEYTEPLTILTGANGEIELSDIEIGNIDEDIIITLTELSVPTGYKLLKNSIEVTLKYIAGSGVKVISGVQSAIKTQGQEYTEAFSTTPPVGSTAANYEVSINAQDIPIMNLGGKVWEEKQSGSKLQGGGTAQNPDGKYNFGIDELLSDIKVSLYKGATQIKYDVYGNELTQYTDGDGRYEFDNIEAGNDYRIEFEYDGVTYIEYKEMLSRNTSAGYSNASDSDASEVGRQAFNDKFAIITGGTHENYEETTGTAIGGSSPINLIYLNQNKGETNDDGTYLQESILQTKEKDPITGEIIPGKVKPEFKMYANISSILPGGYNWLNTWTNDAVANTSDSMLNLDCGLVRQEVDLSLMTDVYSATTTINDKITTYTYNKLEGLGNIIDIGEEKTEASKHYNLFLYLSDYNFRIESYLQGGVKNNVNDNDNTEVAGEITTGEINKNQELAVYVKYAILLTNQSITKAKVNKVVDYFDPTYELVTSDIPGVAEKPRYGKLNSEEPLQELTITEPGTQNIDGILYNKVNIEGMDNTTIDSAGSQIVMYLTFKVNKTDDADIDLIADDNLIEGVKSNIAEIVSYSSLSKNGSSAGMIDIDSAPGNCVLKTTSENMIKPDGNSLTTLNYTLYCEDDTDSAGGITIKKPDTSDPRTINGIVWDDTDKDGIYDTGEQLVDDVTVQLIEIKNKAATGVAPAKQLEYVWQEMRTGTNNTIYLSVDGTTLNSRNSGIVAGTGAYKFTDIIPGDYIIRYIYGDGRVFDYNTSTYSDASTDNIKNYNGNDYKSTISDTYNKEWFDEFYSRDETKNVAVDNEARRLEVMAYSTNIDKTLGEKLKNHTPQALEKTWMCAETPKIKVYGEYNKEIIEGEPISGLVGDGIPDNAYNIKNVRFGVTLRPYTNITLDKHITGLKITTADRYSIIRYI